MSTDGLKAKNNIHAGHRKRMREKAEVMGFDNLPEHEQLEMLLFYIIPRGNTNETAHALIAKFGSLYGVLSAEIEDLEKVDGVGHKSAEFLHSLPVIAKAIMSSKHAFIDSDTSRDERIKNIKEFVRGQFINTVMERVIAVYISPSLKIIKCVTLNDGTFDKVSFEKSRVVRDAITYKAAHVVLSHNHPSGAAFPSEADIYLNSEIENALRNVGVEMLDHIIVGGSGYFSFRESGML